MEHPACTVCREAGHRASKCPEVFSDLKWGFYEGASAGGGDDHDHEDKCPGPSKLVMHLSVDANTISGIEVWLGKSTLSNSCSLRIRKRL